MSQDDTPRDDAGPESTDPIVIESTIHGDVADWNPAAPPPPVIQVISITQTPSIAAQPVTETMLVPGETKRASGLDALRGLFLISMTLGFTIATRHLPLWMYHRQFPFDASAPVNEPGISWRDLTYGAFLFTMAAALPLTLSRRVQKGEVEIGIIGAALKRYLVLLFFALLIGHSNTFDLGYTQSARALSILGFVIMAMVYTRRRSDWNEARFRVVHLTGWALALLFLLLTPLTYGKSFSFGRIDDIIVGLAFASLWGSVIWYFTRDNLVARLGILAIAVALYLGAKGDGWVARWWFDARYPWLFSAERFGLLTVVIPGTIVGDVILKWMRSPPTELIRGMPSWSATRIAILAGLCVAITPIVTVGLYNRNLEMTTDLVGALLVAGVMIGWHPVRPVERMLRSLFLWGGCWLIIGLCLEPFEGGIHKVPDNLSYFFTITGTTSLLLVALTAIIDGLDRRKWVAALIDVGQNPLLVYVVFTIFINSIFEMIPPMRQLLLDSIPLEAARYALEVLLVVVIARAATKRRIFWRA